MISSLRKALVSIRAKELNFLQNHLFLVPFSIRSISENAAFENSFTVSYLMNSCGLTRESALSVSRKVKFRTSKKPDSFISLLKTHGFSQSQIISLIKKNPTLLLIDAEKNLLPKFEFFHSKGFTDSDLAKVFSANPRILNRSLDACIIPNFNFVDELMRSCDGDKKAVIAFEHFVPIFHLSLVSLLALNLQLLYECGVPKSNVLSALATHSISLASDHESVKSVVDKVKKMGFDPSTLSFVNAVQVFLGMSKSLWERKLNLCKEWGWSDEEIWSAFRKFPRFILISERKLMEFMKFNVNEMAGKYQVFAHRPQLMHSSLEKRVFPRCLVLNYLLSKGLIKEDFSVQRVLTASENKFLQQFVIPYQDPHLSKLYAEKIGLPIPK